MNEFGELLVANRRLALNAAARAAIMLRSLVRYADAIEVDLVFLRGLATDASYWHDAVYTDEPDRIRVGFGYAPDVVPPVGRIVEPGPGEPLVVPSHLGGGGGGTDWLYLARLRLTPYATNGVVNVAWSWTAAGLPAGHEAIPVPPGDPAAFTSIWDRTDSSTA